MPSVLVPIAKGVEEIEAVTVLDTLRRAGWEVVAASLSEGVIEASRGVKLVGDCLLADVLDRKFDCIVIPGGMGGVENLRNSPDLLKMLSKQADSGWLASICAGPLVLHDAGLLKGKRYTSHPSVAESLTDGVRVDEPVVVDGHLITSQGPGTALDFALRMIECLESRESSLKVSGPMCRPDE